MPSSARFRAVRWLAFVVVLAALPATSAADPYAVLLDWQEGYSPLGTSVLLVSPLAPTFAFDVNACHRALLVDLLYGPADTNATLPGVGTFRLQHDFLVELLRENVSLATQRVRSSGYGTPFPPVADAGEYAVRVSLANGADVHWQLRVRGHAIVGELACEPRVVVNEIEANPPGPDEGKEWIELFNAGDEDADLGLWSVSSTSGATSTLTLPADARLAPGARLVVTFSAGQFLDNANESVRLVDAFGRLRDATPTFTDAANDARTWQRSPDGSDAWTFAPATPP